MVHRVIVPDPDFPKEYAILLTDKRSIFVRLEKTRSKFLLEGEMRYGTALITDVPVPTLEDYSQTDLDSLAGKTLNFAIPHKAVVSLAMKKEVPAFRYRDLWIWLTMRRQKEVFQVYRFEMTWLKTGEQQARLALYLVPLGAYFKPRRQSQTRATILREYAQDVLGSYEQLLPHGTIFA